jgi:hypothetical protein
MIRKNPCHDTETPGGCWINPDVKKGPQTLGDYIQQSLEHEKKLEDEGTGTRCRNNNTQQR